MRRTEKPTSNHAGLLAALAALLLAGCAGTQTPAPLPVEAPAPSARQTPDTMFDVKAAPTPKEPVCYETAFREEGQASWYGARYHGRPTASGEPYDMEGHTAAHRQLPFGTVIRVTNLDNGRSVTVKVNDRGPRPRRRIVDLSQRAAADLDMIRQGVVPVRVAALRCG